MELTDEQLNNVAGGGSGTIPEGGITYSPYESAYGDRFYAKNVGDTDLIRTFVGSCGASYYEEKLTINTETNTWSTETICQIPCPSDLYSEYPYVLNIRP